MPEVVDSDRATQKISTSGLVSQYRCSQFAIVLGAQSTNVTEYGDDGGLFGRKNWSNTVVICLLSTRKAHTAHPLFIQIHLISHILLPPGLVSVCSLAPEMEEKVLLF